MKILHVCAIGITAKKLLRPQIDYLRSRGLTVEIACSPDADMQELQQQGYIVHPLEMVRKISPLDHLASLIQLVQLMQQQHYDLVHVHTPIAAVLGRIAAKLAGVQRIVYTAHGFPFHDQLPSWQYHLYFGIEKFCAQFTHLILTQSYEDFYMSQNQGLCRIDQVRHLSNGIDRQQFSRERLNPDQQHQLRRSLGIPDHAGPIIGAIGRLTRPKGFAYLLEATAQLLPRFPQLQVLIIGGQLNTDPEPFEAELHQQAIDLGLQNCVTFTGYREDTPQLLGLLDVFVLPTYFGEGLPRSILEAMAMGLPIVTTDIRGCREAVTHEWNGLVVPPRDSEKLAEALAKLLSDVRLRQQFGQASRQRIETDYDEELVFQRLANSYQALGIVFPAPSEPALVLSAQVK